MATPARIDSVDARNILEFVAPIDTEQFIRLFRISLMALAGGLVGAIMSTVAESFLPPLIYDAFLAAAVVATFISGSYLLLIVVGRTIRLNR